MAQQQTHDPAVIKMMSRIDRDLAAYCEQCLKIRDKFSNLRPFKFNSAQHIIHNKAEDQLAVKRRVRLIVSKGRQQGCSTYVGGRYYKKTSTTKLINTTILTHRADASDNLFAMVDRFQKHNPMRPHVGNNNVRELEFDRLDSHYLVMTAGSKETGRGGTASLFHGSEAAFWENAKQHFKAGVQAVPDIDGSEIFIESTSNGCTGEFYERVQNAIGCKGEYELVFIPWYLQPEYARPDLVTSGFELSRENTFSNCEGESLFNEIEYADMFGLNLAQMAWRRNKIYDMRDVGAFDQEYPATVELSFQQSSIDAYHSAKEIAKARRRFDLGARHGDGPLIMGVDPAGEGGDRFAIAYRRGYVCEKIEWRDKVTTPEAALWLKELIDEHEPAVVFIDAGGIGAGIISLLKSYGPAYSLPRVKPVNFGSKSQFKLATPKLPGPINRRAEMYKRTKEWLALEEGVSIPDMPVLQADLLETKIKKNLTNDLQLESKQEIRERGARSPDLADALGLTFADLTFIREWKGPKKHASIVQIDRMPETVIVPSQEEMEWFGNEHSWME